MLNNTKGMTLVEMIVSIAVFSIAAMILAAGFSTVIHYFGEANAVKSTSNEVYSLIESENKSLESNVIPIKIVLEDGTVIEDEVVKKSAKQKIHNDSDSYQVSFYTFSKDVVKDNASKAFLEQLNKALQDYLQLGNQERINTYNDKLKELGRDDLPSITGHPSNDNFRRYFFVMYLDAGSFPKIDQKIINKCNEIFDSMHTSDVTKARLGDDTYYMKTYYMANDKKIMLLAEKHNDSENKDQWRTKLVFNPDDSSWYYKIFTDPGTASINTYLNIAGFTKAGSWDQLKADLKDGTKWRKIVID